MSRKTLVTTNPLYWMPVNLDQWLNEIGGGLLPEQKGALFDLMATAWKQEPPCTLPDDPAYLAARSGLGARWRKLAPAILKHFVAVQDGRLQCPWLLELYKVQLAKYEKRRDANIENRAKRDQAELFEAPAHGKRGTKRRTSGGTIAGTIGTTTAPQSKELELDVVPEEQRKTTTRRTLETASTRAADAPTDRPTSHADVAAVVVERLWRGAPPVDWSIEREGSVLKALHERHSYDEIMAAVCGLALLRDHPGKYGDVVDWLRPGDKATCRALYNTDSGVSPMFVHATNAFWKHADGLLPVLPAQAAV